MINEVTIKGSSNKNINGIYKIITIPNVDKNTNSYWKDKEHQLYRYKNIWRIAQHGVKVYIDLPCCRVKEWNINELDITNIESEWLINKNRIHILKPVINKNLITYTYLYNGKKYSFSNKFLSDEILYTGIEGIISIFVPHCILTGKTIFSEIPVDETFINNLQNLVPIFKKWHNNNNLQLNIDVPIKKNNIESTNKKTISTFTMGVDSFYTLYSNIDKLDAILFIIGFDIKKNQKKLLDETIENLKKVSKIYNKKLILCETDLKNKINHGKGFQWGHYFHGPALFNIIYSLNEYQETLIPSTHLFKDEYLWGSQYILDKNYSSSFLNILHSGDLTRVAKIKFILDYDLKCLDFLRVCWRNIGGKYNCTKCEKCFRTLYPIELYGYKDRAVTFNRNVNGKDFWNFKAQNNSDKSFQKEIKDLENNNNKFTYNIVPSSKTLNGPTYHHVLKDYFQTSIKWVEDKNIASYSNIEDKSIIKNIIPELSFLDNKKDMHMFFKKNNISFYPNSFLDNEINKLENNKSYLVKPAGYSNNAFTSDKAQYNSGNGIKVFKDLHDIKKFVNNNPIKAGYVIQENLTELDLINGQKYDIRCYLLAVCNNHTISYYYYSGYARLTKNKYDKNSIDMSNILTNTHFQQNLDGFTENKHIQIVRDFDTDNIREEKIISCLTELSNVLPNKSEVDKGIFLLGVDFLFDEQFNPYIIEFNYNPGFRGNKIKEYTVLQDNLIHNLVNYFFEPMLCNKTIRNTGNFIKTSDKNYLVNLGKICDSNEIIKEVNKIMNIKKKDECINLGQICNPNSILDEIERLQSDFYDKKYIPGKTDKKLYDKTSGWSGIPLINVNGINGEEGLRLGGSLNNGLNSKLVKYTKVMEKSIILQQLVKNIETKFKTKCVFARILKLKKGGNIYDHTDGDIFNKKKYRCAIPLTKCYPDCWMNINKESYYMEPGNFYSTNVSYIHSVTNNSEVDRINIVIDLLPSEKLIKSIHYGKGTKIIPYYFKKNNNKNLIISFSGFGSGTPIKNYDGTTSYEPAHFVLSKTLKKYTNYDQLFIRDLHKTWYSTGIGDITSNLEENVSLLKELTKNYDKIITIGASSGGYASILYGNLLNVDKVISFSPQIFIDKKTKILKKDTRWMSNNPFYKNINQDSKYLNLNNINLLSKNIIYVGYNDLDRGDLDAVNYLNISKNVEIVKYILPESITNTHYLLKYLVEKSLLNNILDEHMI